MAESPVSPSLKRFFDRLVRRSLSDLRLASEPVADYLSSLLARFARTDQLYAIRGAGGQRLETVVDLRHEAERAWAFDAPDFDPFRERDIRRHVGDYTLFMLGIFRERVEGRAGIGLYVREGKRAYQVVADFQRSALKPDGRLYAELSHEFERYAFALRYMKGVYLRASEPPAPFGPVLRLLTEW